MKNVFKKAVVNTLADNADSPRQLAGAGMRAWSPVHASRKDCPATSSMLDFRRGNLPKIKL
jgi:hypothetical protein